METLILDTGPLVAYLEAGEQAHEWVTEEFRGIQSPLLTCDVPASPPPRPVMKILPVDVELTVVVDSSQTPEL